MTRAEMTEIFAVLMIAYPNAEMFKAQNKQALMERLAPTISLWTTCLADIDYWLAQKATIRVCQSCKFPPTIAEMREAAEEERREVRREIRGAYDYARNEFRWRLTDRSTEEIYERLPARTKKTIEAMGGLDAFMPPESDMFNMDGFEQTYETLLRKNPLGLPGETGGRKAIGNGVPARPAVRGEDEQRSGADAARLTQGGGAERSL